MAAWQQVVCNSLFCPGAQPNVSKRKEFEISSPSATNQAKVKIHEPRGPQAKKRCAFRASRKIKRASTPSPLRQATQDGTTSQTSLKQASRRPYSQTLCELIALKPHTFRVHHVSSRSRSSSAKRSQRTFEISPRASRKAKDDPAMDDPTDESTTLALSQHLLNDSTTSTPRSLFLVSQKPFMPGGSTTTSDKSRKEIEKDTIVLCMLFSL